MGRSFVKVMIGEGQFGLGLVWWGTIQGSVVGDGLIYVLSDSVPRPLKTAEEVLRFVKEKRVFFAKLSGVFGENPGIDDSRRPERRRAINQPLRCNSAGNGWDDCHQQAESDGATGRGGHVSPVSSILVFEIHYTSIDARGFYQ
jgi:hypothetical protein